MNATPIISFRYITATPMPPITPSVTNNTSKIGIKSIIPIILNISISAPPQI